LIVSILDKCVLWRCVLRLPAKITTDWELNQCPLDHEFDGCILHCVQGSSQVKEMYAQIVYKDHKIIELNNRATEQDQRLIDLQAQLIKLVTFQSENKRNDFLI